MNNKIKSLSKGQKTLYILAIIAVVLIIYRLLFGLGSATNLTDGYPWGLWIGIDIMAGIAMTTGGLILAVMVLVFGKEKYKPLLRPSLLTAFLGYVLEMIGLIPDLGRPWMLWTVFFNWNNTSVMFLVGWCVIFQAIVLATIFAPLVFEQFKMKVIQKYYDKMVPWVSVFLISFFVYLISSSFLWTIVTFVLFAVLWFVFKSLVQNGILLLLSVIGIVISISHQIALGALFTLVPEKLAGLWYSPLLQVYFLVTAVVIGLAMIIFESTLSSKAFKFNPETHLLRGVVNILPWMLLISIVLRVITLNDQTGFNFGNAASGTQIFSFFLEVIIGLILPFILLLLPGVRNSAKSVFNVACMVIFGVLLNRMNVAWIGIDVVGYKHYVPFIFEIFITIGIFSIGLLLFYNISRRYPIFNH